MGTRVAFIYDFDGTLARGNIQETAFIPAIGMTPSEFWAEVKAVRKREDADQILIYMQLMLEKARERNIRVTREQLAEKGRRAQLFPGLDCGGWFHRVQRFAEERGLIVDHYIVSSGTYEMIHGCPIAKYFKRIFASKFMYNAEGDAVWPAVSINYTTKTQYLFRINKGIDNTWDDDRLNAYMPEAKRPVRFENMIFFGDGDTDVPTMKMMKHKGGTSIAVYESTEASKKKIHSLISNDRVDFTAEADYCEDSQLDITVRGILGRIARRNGYMPD